MKIFSKSDSCVVNRGWLVAAAFAAIAFSTPLSAMSLRFHGNGVNDIDRVKIRVNPQVPADIGVGNFTIEFWMKALPGDYIPQRFEGGGLTGAICNTQDSESWINGDIILDRALWQNLSFGEFGLSMFPSGLAFGVLRGGVGGAGICGSVAVNDAVWHHIAITRNGSTGAITLYVDGALDAQGTGPSGNISYDDNRALSASPPVPSTVDRPNVEPFLVIGAEKYSLGDRYPSFSGWLDELRLSNSVRYTGASFIPPTQPFSPDANTLALYHFDEGAGDTIGDVLLTSPGVRSFGSGGARPQGPEWSIDSPFGSTPSPPTLQFTAAAYSVSEAGGSATINVSRVGSTAGAVSVNYATGNGTALAGADYTGANGTLSWANGETGTKSFSVPIASDADDESNETVNLTLSNPAGGAVVGRGTAVLTIIDDDGPATVVFSQSSFSVNESAGSTSITVIRSGNTGGSVTVNYSTSNGTALAGADYTTAASVLTFGAGVISQTFSVPIVDDTDVENNETVNLTLSNPNGAVLGAPSAAVLTIVDDDGGGGDSARSRRRRWRLHRAPRPPRACGFDLLPITHHGRTLPRPSPPSPLVQAWSNTAQSHDRAMGLAHARHTLVTRTDTIV